MTVWKFLIKLIGAFEIEMPEGAVVLHVDLQKGEGGVLWALVDPDKPLSTRVFNVVGTGQFLGSRDTMRGTTYVGTYQIPPFVWHVFEITKEAREP